MAAHYRSLAVEHLAFKHDERVLAAGLSLATRESPPWTGGRDRRSRLANPQILSRFFALVRDDIEGHLCAFNQRTEARFFDRRDMDEYVLAAAIWRDESITLYCIKPFHSSARHVALRCYSGTRIKYRWSGSIRYRSFGGPTRTRPAAVVHNQSQGRHCRWWRHHRCRRLLLARRDCDRRFERSQKLPADICDLPTCFVPHHKWITEDIEFRGARCQALRSIGPVWPTWYQDTDTAR